MTKTVQELRAIEYSRDAFGAKAGWKDFGGH